MTTAVEQPRQALVSANDVRRAMAAVRLEVAGGSLSLAEALADPRARRLFVHALLRAQRGWGDHRASEALVRAGIGERRRIDALTAAQRARLVQACRPVPSRASAGRRTRGPWLLDAGPFVAFIERLGREHGSVRAAEIALGLSESALRRYVGSVRRQVTIQFADRVLCLDGRFRLGDLWPELDEVPA